jgi:hypothetical protein
LSFSSFPSTQYTSDGSYVTVSIVGNNYKIETNSTADDGGGNGGGSSPVPEFNLGTIVLIMIVTLFGISLIRREK